MQWTKWPLKVYHLEPGLVICKIHQYIIVSGYLTTGEWIFLSNSTAQKNVCESLRGLACDVDLFLCKMTWTCFTIKWLLARMSEKNFQSIFENFCSSFKNLYHWNTWKNATIRKLWCTIVSETLTVGQCHLNLCLKTQCYIVFAESSGCGFVDNTKVQECIPPKRTLSVLFCKDKIEKKITFWGQFSMSWTFTQLCVMVQCRFNYILHLRLIVQSYVHNTHKKKWRYQDVYTQDQRPY